MFATIESRRVVPGRSRIGGTVAAIAVREGDHVELGQVIATVGDDKLALQMKSLDAQIAGLEAQVAQAQTDLTRAEDLFQNAASLPKTRLDEARTASNVAANAHARTHRGAFGDPAATHRGQCPGAGGGPRAEGAADRRHRRAAG